MSSGLSCGRGLRFGGEDGRDRVIEGRTGEDREQGRGLRGCVCEDDGTSNRDVEAWSSLGWADVSGDVLGEEAVVTVIVAADVGTGREVTYFGTDASTACSSEDVSEKPKTTNAFSGTAVCSPIRGDTCGDGKAYPRTLLGGEGGVFATRLRKD